LQAQYPEDLDGEHSSAAVDELAGEYLSALRKVQPSGPYQFVGLCRGAHIAFEMARRLQAAGELVGFVGILTPGFWKTHNRFLFVEYYFRRLVSLLRLRPRSNCVRSERSCKAGDSSQPGQTATAGAARQSRNPVAVYFRGRTLYRGRLLVGLQYSGLANNH
jgi:hypothetical protein